MSRRRSATSTDALEALLETGWLWERLPAVVRDQGPDAARYPAIVGEIKRRLRLEERSEWSAYGSGAASFADVWLYRDTKAFRRPLLDGASHSYSGVWIAICTLAPCCVMGEGEASWSLTNGARYMPSFSGVDRFATDEVARLALDVERLLSERGIVRLSKDSVAEFLPDDVRFPTNLSEGPLRIFDALFHWDD